MDFQEAANRYAHLRSLRQSGQISQQQFEESVAELSVQAADGVWWQMRAADGTWMRWNGTAWELPQSAPPAAAVPPKEKKSRRGLSCLMIALIVVVVLVCGLALVGGGGYYLISTGRLSYIQLANITGSGRGDISLINLDDVPLEASLVRLDTEDGSPENVGSQTLQPFDIGGFGSIEAGRYRLDIRATQGGSCTLEIVRGDDYRFVAVPEGIAVTRAGETVQNADQINMAASTWCQK